MSTMLKKIKLMSQAQETKFFDENPFTKRTCYSTLYPFNFFPTKGLENIEFGAITILYGNNGSGKSTVLNIIAEKIKAHRRSPFNKSPLFHPYVKECSVSYSGKKPDNIQILTSDDVSEYLLDMRYLCNGLDVKREELFEEYTNKRESKYQLSSLDDYDEFRERQEAKRVSQSAFVRNRLMRNPDMQSNGETAIRYFYDTITEDGIYLIDEAENSLSPKLQQELAKYIIDSARYFNCQFIIATHSPFFLSIPDAKIYNLDESPVKTEYWTDLPNMRAYFDLFIKYRFDFQ